MAINLPELKAKVVLEDRALETAAAKAAVLGAILRKELGTSGGAGEAERGIAQIGRAVENAGKQMGGWEQIGKVMGSVGAVISANFIPALVVLGAVLSPVVLLLGSFAVGLTAALAVATGGLAIIGGLGAGVLLLGSRTAEGAAQLQKLTQHLASLADWLGKLAQPLMAPFIGLLTNIADRVGHLGVQILQWLGPQMQGVVRTSMLFVNDLIGALQSLGPVVARFFDAFQQRAPALSSLFGASLEFMVQAADGLLTNLLRLSDWFEARLPTYGPMVAAIMSGMGSAVQALASGVGRFVDFFVARWPQIAATAKWVWDQFSAGWNDVAPMLREQLPKVLEAITLDLDSMRGEGKPTADALRSVGEAAGYLAMGVLAIAGALAELDRDGKWLLDWLDAVDQAGIRLGQTNDRLIAQFGRLLQMIGPAAAAFGAPGFSGTGTGGGGIPHHLQHGGIAPPGSAFISGEAGAEMGYSLPGGGTMIVPMSSSSGSSASAISTRRIERLLEIQNQLLATMATTQPNTRFSNRAYGV